MDFGPNARSPARRRRPYRGGQLEEDLGQDVSETGRVAEEDDREPDRQLEIALSQVCKCGHLSSEMTAHEFDRLRGAKSAPRTRLPPTGWSCSLFGARWSALPRVAFGR